MGTLEINGVTCQDHQCLLDHSSYQILCIILLDETEAPYFSNSSVYYCNDSVYYIIIALHMYSQDEEIIIVTATGVTMHVHKCTFYCMHSFNMQCIFLTIFMVLVQLQTSVRFICFFFLQTYILQSMSQKTLTKPFKPDLVL